MIQQEDVVALLQRQNRLLKAGLWISFAALSLLALVAAKSPDAKAKFSEIDVERINIVMPDGRKEMVLANRTRLPRPVIDGREIESDRAMPGIIFYNETGDENGGLIFDGKLDANGKPMAGMHFSMDRFGGDQQLALGHYESNGSMETGLNIYDRGLSKDYGPLYEAYSNAPAGEAKEQLKQRWIAAGGRQTTRLFVGKTRGESSAVILADGQGRPRIMMLVAPDGAPMLNFMDEQGNVVQSLPEKSSDSAGKDAKK
ncbi:MAG: hypothetical protein ABIQ48_05525 [Luteimonas sp.]